MRLESSVSIVSDEIKSFSKVAVLYGGTSSEREISLITGKAVFESLQSKGLEVILVDTIDPFIEVLKTEKVTHAWIALHGSDGEDGKIQSILNMLKIKYTGSDPITCSITMNKYFTKTILKSNGFKTPEFMVVDSSTQYENIIKKIKEPFVLKQCSEGSSIGIYIIESKEEYLQHFSEIEKSNDWIIAEQFMQGDEYTSTFLDGRALPIIKIQAKNHEFYDYDAKYLSDETKYICPCELDAEIEMAINEECERAFNLFNIKGWGRLDFFLDQHNAPVILEINTVPGMTTHSLVPMSAKEAGIDFESLCFEILKSSD
ncbi:MAG: D-alanine--D-alanine ligase [Gammaproteobacteria bacterium]|nr:D-alanine--D-alanine ligase [Gammaproteobacteria bacterium]